jgi:hypothetical protein
MLDFYDKHEIEARLDNMNRNMLGKKGKTPKLRGRAAEVRALVPFSVELAALFLKENVSVEQGTFMLLQFASTCV